MLPTKRTAPSGPQGQLCSSSSSPLIQSVTLSQRCSVEIHGSCWPSTRPYGHSNMPSGHTAVRKLSKIICKNYNIWYSLLDPHKTETSLKEDLQCSWTSPNLLRLQLMRVSSDPVQPTASRSIGPVPVPYLDRS